MSWSLLQVSSWGGRPSETVTDCLGLSYMCSDDLGTVAYCLAPGTLLCADKASSDEQSWCEGWTVVARQYIEQRAVD
ncbi:hypothetical protein DPMN_113890 [Dreissena polymorpha]|uniref:Uncharacterized protein n=1 Tax=Dreissena polymorpha TaxID=45954 RepID=A0A9D4KIX3_DREPO|nr:hypothetical protein DPMN_113890 [Dreissena polymorpha]